VHPFSVAITKDDVRITTRLRPSSLLSGLRSTVHESGHALYELNRNEKYDNQHVQNYVSVSVHESQSLFWERHVIMGKPFWNQWWDRVKDLFHLQGQVEDVYKAVNAVNFNNLIRVEADELTYPLHIILRFEIERELFKGQIDVNDLPRIWNDRMEQYLGIRPTNDSNGVLQDVHWSSGYFGYFCTYSIGAMYAAQIAALPQVKNWIEKHDYAAIRTWLREHIHAKGAVTIISDKLIQEATGEGLNPKFFVEYLKQKYEEIYRL
jgi:carboxypeptidase Taq